MIVVAVIAILAAIAYPSYNSYVTKTRRAAGGACAMEAAHFMERYYTTHMSYLAAALPQTECMNDIADNYKIQLPDASLKASAYIIEAVPQGTQQARDEAKCGTLSIDQKGTKGSSGSAAVSECW